MIGRRVEVDALLRGAHSVVARRRSPHRRSELALAAGPPQEHHELASDGLREFGAVILLNHCECEIDARSDARRGPDRSVVKEDRVSVDVDRRVLALKLFRPAPMRRDDATIEKTGLGAICRMKALTMLPAREHPLHVRIVDIRTRVRERLASEGFTVAPFMEDIPDVVIEEKDIRVDTYRATGAGGQHINTTDSAIRITHLPTGIVVTCQNQRSQIQNRARAMQVLAAKLAERAREEREAQVASIAGPTSAAAWGNQIRSYVLAPYQMVKDLRTQHETAKVDAVLDGDIEEFMEAWLHWRRDPTSNSV